MKLYIASGHFAPCLKHHLDYLKDAKSRSDYLIVIVNTDKQGEMKGSCPFTDEKTRLEIIQSFKFVDEAILARDSDGGVADTIEYIVNKYDFGYRTLNVFTGNKSKPTYFFAKGGSDRSNSLELPSKEVKVCKDLGVEIIYGCGGFDKKGSSSWTLRDVYNWYKNKENNGL